MIRRRSFISLLCLLTISVFLISCGFGPGNPNGNGLGGTVGGGGSGGSGGSGQSGPLIVALTLPNGVVGTAYTATLAASGGALPYTWKVASGSLPAGLSLNTSSGLLSGTPTATGTFNFGVQVTDATAPTAQVATQTFSIDVTASGSTPPPLTINAGSLPNGAVSVVYSATLGGSGGKGPYTWALAAGTLPNGLNLDTTTGAISGTPTTQGAFNFTIQLTDSSAPAQIATQAFSIIIGPAPPPPAPPLAITNLNLNGTLPGGTVGVVYNTVMTATGGATPYAWFLTSGALPTGLSMTNAGVISGTPTTAGTFTFDIQVLDSSTPAQLVQVTTSITIAPSAGPPPPNPLLITSGLGNAIVGTGFSGALMASGGTPPYTFAITVGTLPAGLNLDTTTGQITGTPTTAGTSNFTAQVTDSVAAVASADFSITVSAALPPGPLPLAVNTSSVPSGSIATTYTVTLSASGGVPPYSWSIGAGSLPPGITLSSTGLLSGAPTAAGTFNFTVAVNDSATPPSTPASQALSLVVGTGGGGGIPPLAMLTSSLPDGTANSAYNVVLSAAGGTFPYTWSITTGSLPTGLTLDPNGIISGTPTSTATSTITLRVADSSTPVQTVNRQLSLTIQAPGPGGTPLAISPVNLANATAGTPYTVTMVAIGGTPPYSWSIVSGSLPPGLTIAASTGVISGTPTTPGSFAFTAQASDNSAPKLTATGQFAIVVNAGGTGWGAAPPVQIATPSVPNGTAGTAYSATFDVVTNTGTPPFTWSLASGTLPPGLILSSAGVLSGTPTTTGLFSFSIRVTDTASPPTSAVGNFNIQVAGAPPPPPPPPPAGTPPQFANLFMCQMLPAGSAGALINYNSYPAKGTTPYDGCSAIPSPADPKPPVYDGTPATVYTDPVFGTKIKRITPQPGMASLGYFPVYSPQQAWSANQTWMTSLTYQGGFLHLFCGQDTGGNECAGNGVAQSHYQHIRQITIPEDGRDQAVAMWDNQNDCIFYDTFTQQVRSVNVCNNDAITVIGNFPTMTDTQGHVLDLVANNLYIKPYAYCGIDDNSTKLASKIVDATGSIWGITVIDLKTPNHYFWMHKLVAPGDLLNTNAPHNKQPANACITPDGDYVEVAWNTPNTATHYGTEQYDAVTGAYVFRNSPYQAQAFGGVLTLDGVTHADQGRLADGTQVIYSQFCIPDENNGYDYRRFTAYAYDPTKALGCGGSAGVTSNQQMAAAYFLGQWHVSGRANIGKTNPMNGWALMSSFTPSNVTGVDFTPQVPFGGEAWAAAFDGSNINFRIAHLQACRLNQYWNEPHATPSRDFHHVMFTSNWRNCTNDATQTDLYIVELP